MRRYGETVRQGIKYKIRIGVYGIIFVGNKLLLTDQDENEIQLPGGGVDHGEQKSHALIREVYEETGWKISPIRHIGTYQRFVFMPEYDLWAQKICHVYYCRGIYPLTKPLEEGHVPILASPATAMRLIVGYGDLALLKYFISLNLKGF